MISYDEIHTDDSVYISNVDNIWLRKVCIDIADDSVELYFTLSYIFVLANVLYPDTNEIASKPYNCSGV